MARCSYENCQTETDSQCGMCGAPICQAHQNAHICQTSGPTAVPITGAASARSAPGSIQREMFKRIADLAQEYSGVCAFSPHLIQECDDDDTLDTLLSMFFDPGTARDVATSGPAGCFADLFARICQYNQTLSRQARQYLAGMDQVQFPPGQSRYEDDLPPVIGIIFVRQMLLLHQEKNLDALLPPPTGDVPTLYGFAKALFTQIIRAFPDPNFPPQWTPILDLQVPGKLQAVNIDRICPGAPRLIQDKLRIFLKFDYPVRPESWGSWFHRHALRISAVFAGLGFLGMGFYRFVFESFSSYRASQGAMIYPSEADVFRHNAGSKENWLLTMGVSGGIFIICMLFLRCKVKACLVGCHEAVSGRRRQTVRRRVWGASHPGENQPFLPQGQGQDEWQNMPRFRFIASPQTPVLADQLSKQLGLNMSPGVNAHLQVPDEARISDSQIDIDTDLDHVA